MPELISFDYAIVRIVPRVERQEFINAGVVLYAGKKDYLGARVQLDEKRLRALTPEVDLDFIRTHLEAIPKICAGGEQGGPIGKLAMKERWHWLVAPRSTVIQLSPVHSGVNPNPVEALNRIFDEMVGS